MNINTSATAAMTTITSSAPGGIGAPIGISQQWLATGNCGGNIKFYPTGDIDGCAGWHSFTDPNSSANNIKNIIQGLEAGTFTAPEAVPGQTEFEFNGGTLASIFNDFESLYNANKDVNDEWRILIPVYQSSGCNNPSGPILIVGFVTATIWQVIGPPTKIINARVECDTFGSGRGDGTSPGPGVISPIGTIPGLVG